VSVPKDLYLVRDVLDKEIVDRMQDPVGKADGITLVIDETGRHPPRVALIEAGVTVLADRLHPRLGRWAKSLARRFGLRRGRPTRISWRKVKSIGIELSVDVHADEEPSLEWEHWLREKVVRHIPGSR
jgi:hypothetical protein